MSRFRSFFFRLRGLFRRQSAESETSEELRAHLDALIDRNLANGMPIEEARFAALRTFGVLEQVKEQCRDQLYWRWFEQISRDLRFSLRFLRRTPVFTVTVIGSLGLCIGANTALFSAFYSLILKPLPFPEPSQLVEIYNVYPKAGVMKLPMSVAQYLDYNANADRFDGFALWAPWTFTVGAEGSPSRLMGARVTPDYFKILRVQPLLGRFYSSEECMPGHDRVVVLTQTYWERHFGGSSSVIGDDLRIDGETFSIIGVAPRSLEALHFGAAVLKPFEWTPNQADPHARHYYSNAFMFARVRPGISVGAAAAQLAILEARFFAHDTSLEMQGLRHATGHRVALGGVRAEQTKSIAQGLIFLQAAAMLLLVIGVVNVTNLMLARANARRSELAVRQALGAGPGALSLQLFTEAMLLVGASAVGAVAVASAAIRVLNIVHSEVLQSTPPITLDPQVIATTFLLSLLIATIVGLLPAARASRANLSTALHVTSHSASTGGRTIHWGNWMVSAQAGLALILLIGSALLIRSFVNVIAIEPGFAAHRFLHVRVALSSSYKGSENVKAARDRLMASLREISGVEAVTTMPGDIVKGLFGPAAFQVRGSAPGVDGALPTAWNLGVTPEFFDTLGIRIVEGRGFSDADLKETRQVHVVDRAFAESHFPGRSPVGEGFEDFSPNPKPEQWPLIVGVAEVARFTGLDVRDPRPYIYTASSSSSSRVLSLIVRTNRRTAEILPLIREQIRRVDPTLPIYDVKRLDAVLDGLLDTRRGVMVMTGVFAVIAVLLAALGIYGMLAYAVSQRTREIGIRMTIGATRRDIVTFLLRQCLSKVGIGLILGLLSSLALTGYLRSELFGIEPNDAATFVVSVLLLLGVAALATWGPARRAAAVDPVITLRSE